MATWIDSAGYKSRCVNTNGATLGNYRRTGCEAASKAVCGSVGAPRSGRISVPHFPLPAVLHPARSTEGDPVVGQPIDHVLRWTDAEAVLVGQVVGDQCLDSLRTPRASGTPRALYRLQQHELVLQHRAVALRPPVA
jgi:hypothetical protein